MKIQVECRSDSQGEETPFRFRLGTRQINVKSILDRWPGKDHKYFKVLTEDGVYILRQDAKSRKWELTFFSQR